MDDVLKLLATSGANIGLIAYSTLVTIALVVVNKERINNAGQYSKSVKEFNESLEPIKEIASKSLTLLEILTRGRV